MGLLSKCKACGAKAAKTAPASPCCGRPVGSRVSSARVEGARVTVQQTAKRRKALKVFYGLLLFGGIVLIWRPAKGNITGRWLAGCNC